VRVVTTLLATIELIRTPPTNQFIKIQDEQQQPQKENSEELHEIVLPKILNRGEESGINKEVEIGTSEDFSHMCRL